MKTLRYNNEVYPDYKIDENGDIFDAVKGRQVAINYVCKSKASPYARVSLRKPTGGRLTALVHIAVCDTYNRHTLPRPEGVSVQEWEQTPQSVKNFVRFSYQVNHIDHDQHNHHPSNLEYTTAKENQAAYQKHRLTSESI